MHSLVMKLTTLRVERGALGIKTTALKEEHGTLGMKPAALRKLLAVVMKLIALKKITKSIESKVKSTEDEKQKQLLFSN